MSPFFRGIARFLVAAIFFGQISPVSAAVVFNEIAWAGTEASAGDEWIELKNTGTGAVDLTGWGIYEGDPGDETLVEPLSGTIPAGGFWLIERTGDDTVADIPASQSPTGWGGGGLSNDGERLVLRDGSGAIVEALDFSGGWSAGQSSPRKTLERIDASASGALAENWASHDGSTATGTDADGDPIAGTPGAENSVAAGSGADSGTGATPDLTPPATVENFSAAASGQTIFLGWDPLPADASGAVILRSETADPDTDPTTGDLPGTGATIGNSTVLGSFSGTGTTDAGLDFGADYFYKIFAFDATKNFATGASATATTAAFSTPEIVISEVGWAGSERSSVDEFLELWNPGSGAISLENWTVAGAATSGGDLALTGSVAPGAYFLIANYDAGASNSILSRAPDLVENSLSLSNSSLEIFLKNGSGAEIDRAGDGGAPPAGASADGKISMARIVPNLRPGDDAAAWTDSVVAVGFGTGAISLGTPGSENLPADTVAPAAPMGLAVVVRTRTGATISWENPGDDNFAGTAAGLEIRFSTGSNIAPNFSGATTLTGAFLPGGAGGSTDFFTVENLPENETGFVAIRATDDAGNFGPISAALALPPDLIAPTVDFSHPAGVYDQIFSLEISASESGATIFFTTDGSIPIETSATFTGALAIGSGATTVSAFAVDAAGNTGATASGAFFVESFSPGSVGFSEFLPNPAGPDEDGEWLEIFAAGTLSGSAVLDGWTIDDGQKTATLGTGAVVPAGGFLVLGRGQTGLTLNNSGDETFTLRAPDGRIFETLTRRVVSGENQSFARGTDGNFAVTTTPTRGAANQINRPKSGVSLWFENPVAMPFPAGLRLSEILPNPPGSDAQNEWIELENLSDRAIFLDGGALRDDKKTWAFPAGSVVEARSFRHFLHTGISLGNAGDFVEILGPDSATVDRADWPKLRENEAWARDPETGDWTPTRAPTPAAANKIVDPDAARTTGTGSEKIVENFSETPAETAARLKKSPDLCLDPAAREHPFCKFPAIRISEILPDPRGVDRDREFVEIENLGDEPADLRGMKIFAAIPTESGADARPPSSGRLPAVEIPPRGFAVLRGEDLKISLRNAGAELWLRGRAGDDSEKISYPRARAGYAFARHPTGRWGWTLPTAEAPNIFYGDADLPAGEGIPQTLRLTEIYPDPAGWDRGAEWLEVENFGAAPIWLGEFSLRDEVWKTDFFFPPTAKIEPGEILVVHGDRPDETAREKSAKKWLAACERTRENRLRTAREIDGEMIAADGFKILECVLPPLPTRDFGTGAAVEIPDFSIRNVGLDLTLRDPAGEILDRVEAPVTKISKFFARTDGGGWAWQNAGTPGLRGNLPTAPADFDPAVLALFDARQNAETADEFAAAEAGLLARIGLDEAVIPGPDFGSGAQIFFAGGAPPGLDFSVKIVENFSGSGSEKIVENSVRADPAGRWEWRPDAAIPAGPAKLFAAVGTGSGREIFDFFLDENFTPAEKSPVKISEIFPNPVGHDTGTGEWLELQNPTENWAEISGLKICAGEKCAPLAGRIAPGDFRVFHKIDLPGVMLRNENLTLVLRDDFDREISRLGFAGEAREGFSIGRFGETARVSRSPSFGQNPDPGAAVGEPGADPDLADFSTIPPPAPERFSVRSRGDLASFPSGAPVVFTGAVAVPPGTLSARDFWVRGADGRAVRVIVENFEKLSDGAVIGLDATVSHAAGDDALRLKNLRRLGAGGGAPTFKNVENLDAARVGDFAAIKGEISDRAGLGFLTPAGRISFPSGQKPAGEVGDRIAARGLVWLDSAGKKVLRPWLPDQAVVTAVSPAGPLLDALAAAPEAPKNIPVAPGVLDGIAKFFRGIFGSF